MRFKGNPSLLMMELDKHVYIRHVIPSKAFDANKDEYDMTFFEPDGRKFKFAKIRPQGLSRIQEECLGNFLYGEPYFYKYYT